MRKAGTIAQARIEVPQSQSLERGAGVFLPFIDNEYGRFFEREQRLMSQIQEYKDRAHDMTREWSSKYKELKGLEKPTPSQEGTQRANTIARAFERHTFIERVTIDRNKMTVWTRLLFSDVRIESGERDTKRRCIGAFKIEVPTNGREYINVSNLLYPKLRFAHWAVKEGTPCLGEYNDNINQARWENDWYTIADTMVHYLRFSGDSSAWMRSHEWIEKRITGMPHITGGGRVRAGASLVMLYGESRVEQGTLHKVCDSRNGAPLIDVEGEGLLEVSFGRFAIIKHSVYKNVESLRDIERKYIEPFDKLPDGATFAEAQALIMNI